MGYGRNDVPMLLKRLIFAAAIWFAWLAGAQSDNSTASCDAPPFALEIKEQQLETGVTSWGVLFQIGDPIQLVSLVPSTVVNSTLVNQLSPLCNISNTTLPNQCESIRGGFFYQNDSSTWRPADLKTSNISRSNPTWDHFNPEGPITEIGTDDILIRGSIDFTLRDAGIALNQRGWQSNAGMIGLGKDSVFLDEVVAQNRSPSRSWGLDSGSRSVVRPRSGELVIGGYNKARILSEEWKEFPVSDMDGARPCPLRVKMIELTLISADGSKETQLKDTSVSIAACIEPYDNRFRWTADMIKNWKDATGFDESLVDPYTATGQNLAFIEPGLPYDKNKTENWQLRIKLDGGYETTITYDEMQRPLEGWNREGQLQQVDGITNVAIFNNATARDEVGTLGKIFLSRTYLRVDYETGKFYLAPADTTASPTESQLEAMKPPQCTVVDGSCEAKGNCAKKTPIGAIVGGVVGGVAFAILFVAFLVWWGKRKRRRAEERRLAPRAPSRSGTNDPEPANGMVQSNWYGFEGRPGERDDRFSNATNTTNGQPLISPRGSRLVNADGSELRRDTTATDNGSSMNPETTHSRGELP